MKLWGSGETRQRIGLALVTVMFLASWVALLVRLMRDWHNIPQEAHHWAIMFAVLYPWPWMTLVLENRSKLQMAVLTYFAFFAAMKFVFP